MSSDACILKAESKQGDVMIELSNWKQGPIHIKEQTLKEYKYQLFGLCALAGENQSFITGLKQMMEI